MKSNMKKVAAAVIGAVAMVGSISSANAEGNYLNLQLGISDIAGYSSGSALIGTLGIPMPEMNPWFSIEGEFTKALGKPEFRWGTAYAEIDYWTLGGYGVIGYPVNDQLTLRGRLGLVYEHIDVQSNVWYMPAYSDNDIGLSYGIGGTLKVSPTMGIIAEYTQMDSDLSHLSAGVQLQF